MPETEEQGFNFNKCDTVSLPLDTVIAEDSIVALRNLPSASIDLILSDIPYGIGAEEWDVLHKNTNSAL